MFITWIRIHIKRKWIHWCFYNIFIVNSSVFLINIFSMFISCIPEIQKLWGPYSFSPLISWLRLIDWLTFFQETSILGQSVGNQPPPSSYHLQFLLNFKYVRHHIISNFRLCWPPCAEHWWGHEVLTSSKRLRFSRYHNFFSFWDINLIVASFNR